MTKTLVISMTPDGYSLTQPIKEKNEVHYVQILRGGTELDLKNSLTNLPSEFYKEGVRVSFNYDNESAPIKIPQEKREELERMIVSFEESEKIFS